MKKYSGTGWLNLVYKCDCTWFKSMTNNMNNFKIAYSNLCTTFTSEMID